MAKMRARRLLWDGIELGEWDASRLLTLFNACQCRKATDRERDAYARMVMILVTANFKRQRWMTSLRRIGMDIEAAASDLVQHVVRKTPGLQIDHPCEKVVADYINRMIVNRMLSLIRHQVRQNQHRVIHDNGTDEDSIFARLVSPAASATMNGIAEFLKSSEDSACRRVPGDIFAVVTLYRFMSRRLLRDGEVVEYEDLPERLQERIDFHEQYTPIVVALRRLAAEAATA